MKYRNHFCLAICVALGATFASAQIVYTCDSTVAAATCNYLNSTVAGYYSATFSNANANIYIRYGSVGLGQSNQYQNFISYSTYVNALNANSNKSPVQTAALSALSTYDAGPYGSGNVEVTSALGTVLGQTGMYGTAVNSDGSTTYCTIGSSGCYNAVITVTNNSAITLYYDNVGGTEPAGAYDFYAVVQHETDEVLGTSSCISTATSGSVEPFESLADGEPRLLEHVVRVTGGASPAVTSMATATLKDFCGAGVPSAVDLYRYLGAGNLVLDSSLSTTDGAYFSYDGGSTKGAVGVDGSGKKYNTKANGADYADFASNGANCATDEAIQNAYGCPGQDAGLTILNDGQGEINILNALGYNLVPTPAPPLTANKKLIDFGEVVYSPTPSSKEDGLDLTNNTSVGAAVGQTTIAATYGDPSQFSVDNSKCSNKVLNPGDSCHIKVVFTPNSGGITRATMMTVTASSAGTVTISIPLTGTGIVNVSQ